MALTRLRASWKQSGWRRRKKRRSSEDQTGSSRVYAMFLTGGYLCVETNKLLIESNAITQLRDSSNQKLCRRHFITIYTAIRRLEACTSRSLAKRTIFSKLRRVISIGIKRSIRSSHWIIRYWVVWYHHRCLLCVLYHLIYMSCLSSTHHQNRQESCHSHNTRGNVTLAKHT